MDEKENDVYIGSGQVAQLFNVSPATIRRWVQSGHLKASSTTIGGHLRFKLSEIRQVLHAYQNRSRSVNEGASKNSDPNWWKEQGQGLVEFSLVIPLILLFVLGFIAFANTFRQVNAMNNAADSGAFYASLVHSAGIGH